MSNLKQKLAELKTLIEGGYEPHGILSLTNASVGVSMPTVVGSRDAQPPPDVPELSLTDEEPDDEPREGIDAEDRPDSYWDDDELDELMGELEDDDEPPVKLSEFREEDHPRHPPGSPEGGQFKAKGEGSGARTVSKQELKGNAITVQDSGMTRGRLPTIVQMDGDLWAVNKDKETGEYNIVPATRADIMPAIASKFEQRGNAAYQSMLTREAEEREARSKARDDKARENLEKSGRADSVGQMTGQAYHGVSAEGFPFTEKRMHPTEIKVHPGMQYKRTEITDDVNQVSDALKGVTRYDQATGGPLTVWEKQDGSVYVMNGHHRRELAIRTGEESLPVRVFREADGVDFSTARGLGALQNVRDGKGTPLDAAFVLKDLGMTLKDLQDAGVNLRSGVGRDAVSLMKLSPTALDMVKQGVANQQVAAGVADQGLDETKQQIALRKAGQGDLETRQQGEILGRKLKEAKVIVRDDGSGNLFGTVDMDVPWAEAAEIESAVINRLAKDERLYRALTRGRAAGESVIDEAAQHTAANAEYLARRAIATTPGIQEAINQRAVAYAETRRRADLLRAVDEVIEIARQEGIRRLMNKGAA